MNGYQEEETKLLNQGWEINKYDQEYPVKRYEYISIGFMLFRRKIKIEPLNNQQKF
ncbi:hypothetical protein KAR91_06710 [Candidatus Pacearchaeota archaeon]|nr:hypothetical protein [Candidatus Pacearchaeota archaeon]